MENKWKAYGVNIVAIVLVYVVLALSIQFGIIDNYIQGIILAIGINIILATSLNLATGFLGELALGHAGFMAVGAYTSALCTMHMNLPNIILFPVSLLIGGIVAGIFGIVIGIPALRLRGDYLGIITLGFGEMIRVLILNVKFTGGARGLKGIMPLTNIHWVFWVSVLTITVLYTLIRSRHGRAIVSIREDEIAADSVGIHTTYYKVMAFSIAAFFAGVGGGLYAHYITVLDATKFGFLRSVEILVIVVLGGMGSFTGSVLAAIMLTILPEALRQFSDYRMLIYSLLLIIMMLFRPSGLLGRRELSLIKIGRYVRSRIRKG